MSHTTTLRSVVIRDVRALKQAADELARAGVKCELLENVKPRMYYATQHDKCAYVLKLPGRYDIGFDKQADGTYLPVMDTWGGDIQKAVGVSNPTCELPKDRAEAEAMKAMGRFQQSYAKFAAINAATAQGYVVESTTTDEKGAVHLVLAGM